MRHVPHTKALSVEWIVKFARWHWPIDEYLPDLKYKYPNRAWICTIGKKYIAKFSAVNSLIEKEFTIFIAEKLRDREKMIVNKKKLSVEAIKKFAELFTKSFTTSRKFIAVISLDYNRKFYQYLRSERKSIYKEIEEDNNANKELIESLKVANEKLQSELAMMSEELESIRNRRRNNMNVG